MSEGKTIGPPRLSFARDLPRWGLAAVAAVGAHAAVAAGVVAFAPVKEPMPDAPVMTVELAPIAFSQAESVDQVETVAALDPEEVAVEETPTTEEEIVETVEEEPVEDVVEEKPEEPVEEEPEVVEEEIEEVEPPPVVKKAEVVLPQPVRKKPAPKPKVEKVEKPAPKPVRKPTPPKLAQGRQNPDAKASSSVNTRRSSSSAPSAASVSSWNSKVRAAIARRKPRSARGQGVVVLSFVVSSSGAITSSRVSRSSGDSRLDSAALAMARGSVPAPPSGHGGGPFTIPIRFE